MIRILVQLFGVYKKSTVARVFSLIKEHTMFISNHKFGIYVIQKVIERDIELDEGHGLKEGEGKENAGLELEKNQKTTSELLQGILLGDEIN